MTEFKHWKKHSGPILESKNSFDIMDCLYCQFKHIVPIPSEKELMTIYKRDYYTTEKPFYIQRNLEDQEWWKIVYYGRLKLFEDFLGPNRRNLLEVGSGPGFFLQRAKERGWKGLGIEPSSRAAAFAKTLGVEVKNDFLTDELAADLGRFDVVYMNEVLEHISDPVGLLTISVKLLKPGGLLCVIVPNDYNPIQQALRDVCEFPSWWVAPPHHINYFDVSSIKSLIRKVGTTIVSTEATFPIDLFLMMGENYIGDDELGRSCHGKRKTLEINLEKAGLTGLRRKLYQSFAEVGVGREIQVIGRKG